MNQESQERQAEKKERRFQRWLQQLENHWPELAAAGTATAVVGLGISVLWAMKRSKDRKSQATIDQAVKETLLSDPEAIRTKSKTVGNLAIFPLISQLGEGLIDSGVGQEIQVQLAFARGFFGIGVKPRSLEEELVILSTYVASEGEEEIKKFQDQQKQSTPEENR